MKANFKITNPEKTECTLKITMPLEEWKRLRDQLDNGYPGWKLSSLISKITIKAQEEFEMDGKFEE